MFGTEHAGSIESVSATAVTASGAGVSLLGEHADALVVRHQLHPLRCDLALK